ncbi:MAG: cytochrome c [Gemmataceae bacterium]
MRMIRRAFAALALGVCAMALAVGGASAKPTEDAWGIEDVMKKLTGKKGAVAKASAAVKAGDWDAAAKVSDTLKHGADLASNKPPRGDQKSWDSLAKAFGDNTSAMVKAISDKDKAAFDKSAKAVGGSCKACHDKHKPN